jgi:hypothetical protein
MQVKWMKRMRLLPPSDAPDMGDPDDDDFEDEDGEFGDDDEESDEEDEEEEEGWRLLASPAPCRPGRVRREGDISNEPGLRTVQTSVDKNRSFA